MQTRPELPQVCVKPILDCLMRDANLKWWKVSIGTISATTHSFNGEEPP
jgi:hypothetical protein